MHDFDQKNDSCPQPYLKSSIFHKGFDWIKAKLQTNKRSLITIADFLYLLIDNSKLTDSKGTQYFLLPNVEWLAEKMNYGTATCSRAIKELIKLGWLKKVNERQPDGAVRSKFYITKFAQKTVEETRELKNQDYKRTTKQHTDTPLSDPDSIKMIESYNKEIKNNNLVNENAVISKNEDTPQENPTPPNPAHLDKKTAQYILRLLSEKNQRLMTFNQNGQQDENDRLYDHRLDEAIRNQLAPWVKQYKIDAFSFEMCLSDLHSSGLYKHRPQNLIADALTFLMNLNHDTPLKYDLMHCDSYLRCTEAINQAEDERDAYLRPLQQLAISQVIQSAKRINKNLHITYPKELFNWIAFSITNKDYHYPGLTFKAALRAIKKTVLRGAFNKPFGFDACQKA